MKISFVVNEASIHELAGGIEIKESFKINKEARTNNNDTAIGIKVPFPRFTQRIRLTELTYFFFIEYRQMSSDYRKLD